MTMLSSDPKETLTRLLPGYGIHDAVEAATFVLWRKQAAPKDEHVAYEEALTLAGEVLGPCPGGCGCERWDDADRNDCGCDAGCCELEWARARNPRWAESN